jgi:hypothetical protein
MQNLYLLYPKAKKNLRHWPQRKFQNVRLGDFPTGQLCLNFIDNLLLGAFGYNIIPIFSI